MVDSHKHYNWWRWSLRLKNYLKGKDEEKIIPEHPSLCNLHQVFCLVFIKFKYQDFKKDISNHFDCSHVQPLLILVVSYYNAQAWSWDCWRPGEWKVRSKKKIVYNLDNVCKAQLFGINFIIASIKVPFFTKIMKKHCGQI